MDVHTVTFLKGLLSKRSASKNMLERGFQKGYERRFPKGLLKIGIYAKEGNHPYTYTLARPQKITLHPVKPLHPLECYQKIGYCLPLLKKVTL